MNDNRELTASGRSTLLSPDVIEIISRKSHWFVRRGNTIFLLIIGLVIVGCWLVQYPDLVMSSARLTSVNAPKEVRTKTDGILIRLFAQENTMVQKNDIIGFMESTADHEAVLRLSARLDSIQVFMDENALENICTVVGQGSINLGELQSAYEVFNQATLQFAGYLSDGFFLQKKKMLQTDIKNLKKVDENLIAQRVLQEEDLKLSRETFEMEQRLSDENVIAPLDYRNERSKFLMKQLSIPQIDAAILSNDASRHEKHKEILELENQIQQQKSIYLQALQTFKSNIEDWKKKYIITAPVGGKVTFAGFLQENQYLPSNKLICFISTEHASLYAETYVPQYNLGKVAVGQCVLLKFPSYPYQEYGTVRGRVDYISTIATDSGYLAKVVLPDGLVTDRKKEMQFRDGLNANCEIITHDMRLLERFYQNLTASMDR
jgi:multidrug efflux pump subunit AcrA (membrane-fusion protein)